MICSKCGAENIEGSMFCNKCGTRLEEIDVKVVYNGEMDKETVIKEGDGIVSIKKDNFFHKVLSKIPFKNKKFIITILSILIIFIVTGSFYIYNKDSYKFKNLFNDKKYSQAQKHYSNVVKNSSNAKKERLDSSIKEYFYNKSKKIKETYIRDTKRYDCTGELGILNNMLSYNIGTNDINLIKDFITKLGDSRYAHHNAIEAVKKKDFITATLNFKKVITDDSNYKDSQTKLKEILPQLKKQQMEVAERSFQSKDYEKALNSLESISQYFDNDKEINDKLSLYKNEKEKQEKLITQQKENRKNELLSYASKYKDQVSNEIVYMPKPYGDNLNIPVNGVIFYPYLRGEIGSDVFKLLAGFNREDWVFMDKIICNADDTIFEINFGKFDRKSEVGFGSGVYEWVEIPSFDTISVTSDQNPNLLDNLNKLGKASNALIKFQGDTKSFDYTLTQQQKNTLLNIIELHNISRH